MLYVAALEVYRVIVTTLYKDLQSTSDWICKELSVVC